MSRAFGLGIQLEIYLISFIGVKRKMEELVKPTGKVSDIRGRGKMTKARKEMEIPHLVRQKIPKKCLKVMQTVQGTLW